MRDLFSRLKLVKSIAAAAIAADNTPIVVDRQGFESLAYEISIGEGGISFTTNNKIEFKLYHSDKETTPTFPGDFTAVTDDDVQMESGSVGEGGIVKALTAAHATADITKVGYIGNKRWTALLADFSGTHTDSPTPIAATAILSDPHRLTSI